MRGDDVFQDELFSYGGLGERVPAKHPLRRIREFADLALGKMSGEFEGLYSKIGRPSIAPEQLLRALLLQMLFTRYARSGCWSSSWSTTCCSGLACGAAAERACVGRDQL